MISTGSVILTVIVFIMVVLIIIMHCYHNCHFCRHGCHDCHHNNQRYRNLFEYSVGSDERLQIDIEIFNDGEVAIIKNNCSNHHQYNMIYNHNGHKTSS